VGVDGAVLETPPEPSHSRFAQSVHQVSYPTHEVNGVVWTYMGPPSEQPPFPSFLWTGLPRENVHAFYYRQDCNYLQAMEGDLDFAHASYLHRPMEVGPEHDTVRRAMAHDTRPRGASQEEWYGLESIYSWELEDGEGAYFRTHPFVLPCFTLINSRRAALRHTWHAWVPIDDHSHWVYYVNFDPENAADDATVKKLADTYGHNRVQKDNDYRWSGVEANRYLQDPDRFANQYSGVDGIALQDFAIQASMGRIVDRSKEHLASEDIVVVQLRRLLLRALKACDEGREPPAFAAGERLAEVASRSFFAPKETSLEEARAGFGWEGSA
jgi:phenylpropionate dioxygenase-like ring-hydroxylating dioxygenase large terminal subunit